MVSGRKGISADLSWLLGLILPPVVLLGIAVSGAVAVGVENAANTPRPQVTGPNSAFLFTPITLDGSSSFDRDGKIVRYKWDLDGDKVFEDAEGPQTDFNPSQAGLFTVALRVWDEQGKKATALERVLIVPAPIEVEAEGPADVPASHSEIRIFLTERAGVEHDAPASFPVGITTPVTFTATDLEGNLISLSSSIAVPPPPPTPTILHTPTPTPRLTPTPTPVPTPTPATVSVNFKQVMSLLLQETQRSGHCNARFFDPLKGPFRVRIPLFSSEGSRATNKGVYHYRTVFDQGVVSGFVDKPWWFERVEWTGQFDGANLSVQRDIFFNFETSRSITTEVLEGLVTDGLISGTFTSESEDVGPGSKKCYTNYQGNIVGSLEAYTGPGPGVDPVSSP